MFTGLIREIAKVKKYENNILSLVAKHKPRLGDSIAVNGVCLTVIKINSDGFDVELADETRSIIDEKNLKGNVHIEPAMSINDRFEGHIVQGHIDCIGTVTSITKRENGVDYIIKVPFEHIKYIIPKGSITIDGVSLTINSVEKDSFRLTIIPHTVKETLIGNYAVGTKVNIETDMFARYIEHILNFKSDKKGIGWKEIDSMSMSY
ncbi:MAG: riboflavin synthase [Sulfurovaceae bacterium]|nr:riboflavin synthase [Sulfurovaceae bacterium]MDD5548456.1 riboflavin synthase [Sulfurovaceae bacterium]